jgi:hypothetical protein
MPPQHVEGDVSQVPRDGGRRREDSTASVLLPPDLEEDIAYSLDSSAWHNFV